MELNSNGFLRFVNENIWKIINFRGILFKHQDKWQVIYTRIELLCKGDTVNEMIRETDNIIIFNLDADFSEFARFYENLITERIFKIKSLDASLDFLNEIQYNIIPKENMLGTFGINENGFYCQYSGKTTIGAWIRQLNHEIKKIDKGYLDFHHACKDLLDIEYGYSSYAPFIVIIAPFFIKLNSFEKDNKNRLFIDVKSTCKYRLKKGSVVVYQYDDKGEVLDKGTTYPISKVKPIELKSNTRYYRAELYYDNIDNPIEDFSQPIPPSGKDVPEEETTKTEDNTLLIEFKKIKSIRNKYQKGIQFENFIKKILPHNLIVAGERVNNKTDEIDLLIKNYRKKDIWSIFDTFFLIECKNTRDVSPADEIRNFSGKLKPRYMKSGIFITVRGLSGRKDRSGATNEIKRIFYREKIRIIVLNGKDLTAIVEGRDFSEVIESRYIELLGNL